MAKKLSRGRGTRPAAVNARERQQGKDKHRHKRSNHGSHKTRGSDAR